MRLFLTLTQLKTLGKTFRSPNKQTNKNPFLLFRACSLNVSQELGTADKVF